jgi:hypothetical protein
MNLSELPEHSKPHLFSPRVVGETIFLSLLAVFHLSELSSLSLNAIFSKEYAFNESFRARVREMVFPSNIELDLAFCDRIAFECG